MYSATRRTRRRASFDEGAVALAPNALGRILRIFDASRTQKSQSTRAFVARGVVRGVARAPSTDDQPSVASRSSVASTAAAAACARTQFPSAIAAGECKNAAASRDRRTFSSLLAHIVASKLANAAATSSPSAPPRIFARTPPFVPFRRVRTSPSAPTRAPAVPRRGAPGSRPGP